MVSNKAHVPAIEARQIAAAVIKQAVADVLNPTVDPKIRRDAQIFLAGHPDYVQWCNAAGIEPAPLLIESK